MEALSEVYGVSVQRKDTSWVMSHNILDGQYPIICRDLTEVLMIGKIDNETAAFQIMQL